MRWRADRIVVILVILASLAMGLTGWLAPDGIESPARVALSILIVAATLWISEAIPLFVTGFLILALGLVWLIPVSRKVGISITNADLLAPFFSDVILLFLGGFVLSAALHRYRLDELVARKMLAKTGDRIPVVLLGIMCITAMLSMWLSNTATAAMMLSICLPIAQSLPEDNRFRKSILLAVPFSANIGGLGTPIGSPPNAIAMQYMRNEGLAPSFGMWLLIGVPGVLVMIAIGWALLVGRARGSSTRLPLVESTSQIQVTGKSWLVASITGVTLIGWVTSGWHGFTSGTVALLPVIVFFGSKLLSIKDLRNLSWDVLFMMGGGLCLGRIIEVSGLDVWILSQLPLNDSDGHVLLVVVSIAACAMSSVMSNTATANLLMPIILGLSVASLSPILVGVAFACTLAMPLPVSTPPNAITFSSGELSVKDMLLPGLIITLTGLALSVTTGYWWWDLVGLF